MIHSLEDLARCTQEWARATDLPAEEVELRSPGLSPVQLDRLRAALPGMPASYLECVARFDLRNVRFGFFELQAATGNDLVQGLVEANEPEGFLYARYMAPNHLYWVASWDADPICVVRDQPARLGGEVIGLDLASGPEPRLYRVAPSFATAMIIAGHALESVNDPAFDGPRGLDR